MWDECEPLGPREACGKQNNVSPDIVYMSQNLGHISQKLVYMLILYNKRSLWLNQGPWDGKIILGIQINQCNPSDLLKERSKNVRERFEGDGQLALKTGGGAMSHGMQEFLGS